MKFKFIALILIPLGIAIITYSMVFMRISLDGEFVNLRLLSDRQNLLILGALATLIGSIFFAVNYFLKRNGPELLVNMPNVGLSPIQKINDSRKYLLKSDLILVLIPIAIWGIFEAGIFLLTSTKLLRYFPPPLQIMIPLIASVVVLFILYLVPWVLKRNRLVSMLTFNKIQQIAIGKSLFMGVIILFITQLVLGYIHFEM